MKCRLTTPITVKRYIPKKEYIVVLMLETLRSRVGVITYHYPVIHRILQSVYRAIPTSIRGERLVYDHFRRLTAINANQSFVLIGANDGMFEDHVYHFVRRYKWRGIAIEPNPMFLTKLRDTYAGRPVQVFGKAVHATEKSMSLYYVDQNPELPHWIRGVGSFNRQHILEATKTLGDLASSIRTIDVECATVSEIIDQAGFDDIDIFVIDTEGYDAEVVRQIDFARFNPHTIIFEYTHLPPEELYSVSELLREKGFVDIRIDHQDLLATKLTDG